MLTRRAIPPEQLLALLEQAIQEAPALLYEEALSESDVRWLGKADALIEASGSMSATLKFRTARNSLHTYAHSRNAIMQPLYDAHSRVELLAPQAMRGRFIAGGDTWNGYVAIVEILQTPTSFSSSVLPETWSSVLTLILCFSSVMEPAIVRVAVLKRY